MYSRRRGLKRRLRLVLSDDEVETVPSASLAPLALPASTNDEKQPPAKDRDDSSSSGMSVTSSQTSLSSSTPDDDDDDSGSDSDTSSASSSTSSSSSSSSSSSTSSDDDVEDSKTTSSASSPPRKHPAVATALPGMPHTWSIEQAFAAFTEDAYKELEPFALESLPAWLTHHWQGDPAMLVDALARARHCLVTCSATQDDTAADFIREIFYLGHTCVTSGHCVHSHNAPTNLLQHRLNCTEWQWRPTGTSSLVCTECLNVLQSRCEQKFGSTCPTVVVYPAPSKAITPVNVPRAFSALSQRRQLEVHSEAARVAVSLAHPQCLFNMLAFSHAFCSPYAVVSVAEIKEQMTELLTPIMRTLSSSQINGSEPYVRALVCLVAWTLGYTDMSSGRGVLGCIARVANELKCAPLAFALCMHPWMFAILLPHARRQPHNVCRDVTDVMSALINERVHALERSIDAAFFTWDAEIDDDMPDRVRANLDLLAVVATICTISREWIVDRTLHRPGSLLLSLVRVLGISLYSLDMLVDMRLLGVNALCNMAVADDSSAGGHPVPGNAPPCLVKKHVGDATVTVSSRRADSLLRHTRLGALLLKCDLVCELMDWYYLVKLLFALHQMEHAFVTCLVSMPVAYIVYTNTWHLCHTGRARLECWLSLSANEINQNARLVTTLLRDNRILTDRDMYHYVDAVREHARSLMNEWSGNASFGSSINRAVGVALLREGYKSTHSLVGNVFATTTAVVMNALSPMMGRHVPAAEDDARYSAFMMGRHVPAAEDDARYSALLMRPQFECALRVSAFDHLMFEIDGKSPDAVVRVMRDVANQQKKAFPFIFVTNPDFYTMAGVHHAVRHAMSTDRAQMTRFLSSAFAETWASLSSDDEREHLVTRCLELARPFKAPFSDRTLADPEFVYGKQWAEAMMAFSAKWTRTFTPWMAEGTLLLERIGFPQPLCVSDPRGAHRHRVRVANSSDAERDALGLPDESMVLSETRDREARDTAVTAFRRRHRIEIRVIPRILEYM